MRQEAGLAPEPAACAGGRPSVNSSMTMMTPVTALYEQAGGALVTETGKVHDDEDGGGEIGGSARMMRPRYLQTYGSDSETADAGVIHLTGVISLLAS